MALLGYIHGYPMVHGPKVAGCMYLAFYLIMTLSKVLGPGLVTKSSQLSANMTPFL